METGFITARLAILITNRNDRATSIVNTWEFAKRGVHTVFLNQWFLPTS